MAVNRVAEFEETPTYTVYANVEIERGPGAAAAMQNFVPTLLRLLLTNLAVKP